jgi:hypothetical protein
LGVADAIMGWFDQFSGPLSEEKFASRLMDQLVEAGDRRQATFDASRFQLQFRQAGQDVGYANLRNLYDEYLTHAARDRDKFFRFAVRSLLASHKPLPDDYRDAACDILVTVRNRSYFSLLEMRNWISADPHFSWPYQPLGEHLGIGLTYDLPEAMVMLQNLHLHDWGVSFYEVYERALGNLAEIDATFSTIDDHSYVSATGDHYDASRMLLPELIQELKVVGDPVAMIPNRDRLLLTGSDDVAGIESVALIAQQLLAHPRPLTGVAFVYRNEEWQTWLPHPDHPAYATLKSLGLQTLHQDYQEQTHLLGMWLSQTEPEARAAEFRLHGAEAKQPPISYCVWQEGQTWLLPRSDRVCLLPAGKRTHHPLVEGLNCSWEQMERIAGDLLEEQEMYPVRYRVREFPTAQQLSHLRSG